LLKLSHPGAESVVRGLQSSGLIAVVDRPRRFKRGLGFARVNPPVFAVMCLSPLSFRLKCGKYAPYKIRQVRLLIKEVHGAGTEKAGKEGRSSLGRDKR
jgi:hypothetical protein